MFKKQKVLYSKWKESLGDWKISIDGTKVDESVITM